MTAALSTLFFLSAWNGPTIVLALLISSSLRLWWSTWYAIAKKADAAAAEDAPDAREPAIAIHPVKQKTSNTICNTLSFFPWQRA